jgi:hypothetical protein
VSVAFDGGDKVAGRGFSDLALITFYARRSLTNRGVKRASAWKTDGSLTGLTATKRSRIRSVAQ